MTFSLQCSEPSRPTIGLPSAPSDETFFRLARRLLALSTVRSSPLPRPGRRRAGIDGRVVARWSTRVRSVWRTSWMGLQRLTVALQHCLRQSAQCAVFMSFGNLSLVEKPPTPRFAPYRLSLRHRHHPPCLPHDPGHNCRSPRPWPCCKHDLPKCARIGFDQAPVRPARPVSQIVGPCRPDLTAVTEAARSPGPGKPDLQPSADICNSAALGHGRWRGRPRLWPNRTNAGRKFIHLQPLGRTAPAVWTRQSPVAADQSTQIGPSGRRRHHPPR